jgi:hypothetical protein
MSIYTSAPSKSRYIKFQKETAHKGEAVDPWRDQGQLFYENRKKAHVFIKTAEERWGHIDISSETGNGG